MKLFPLFLCVVGTMAQMDNLVDTFVSTFTFTTREEAGALLEVFQKCDGIATDQTIFQEVLRTGLNATRTCTSEITRDHARKCIDRVGTVATLSTSPYNVLAIEKLSTSDIDTLVTCGNGVANDDTAILTSVLVIMKRFAQCSLEVSDLTQTQKDAILDVFKGTEQRSEVNRALLSNICSSLHFGGEMHQDMVDFLTASFKTYVVVLPQRRR